MNGKTPTEAEIARKAYELWEAEGRPEGQDIAHWHQAERDVTEPVIDPIPEPPASENTDTIASAPPKPRAVRSRKPKTSDPAPTEEKAPRTRAPRRPKTTPES